MRIAKSWMLSIVAAAAFGGGLALVENSAVRTVVAQGKGLNDHWRYHDGHWSQWNQQDNRWYYTNGNHWFYSDGGGWHMYKFDKHFGRNGFERGAYKHPGPDVKIVTPGHKIYVP